MMSRSPRLSLIPTVPTQSHRTSPPLLLQPASWCARGKKAMEDQGQTEKHEFSSSYRLALEALSTLIGQQRKNTGDKTLTKFDCMLKYVEILDMDKSIAELNIIHVAGTKGKGSTCAFSEAILRQCGLHTGLFTSPHLVDVRERFRIDGSDISIERFLHYFWELWYQLKEKLAENFPMPRLFQFFTLLAFKIFCGEKVDVAIMEVGIGGRWDSTNVIKKPIVCGVTSLGMDHMEILGDSIEKIASEKAGIFKRHVPAFTVPQLPEALAVLREEAEGLVIPLEVAPPLDRSKLAGSKLALDGEHQLINAGLAIALSRCLIQKIGHSICFSKEEGLPETFISGLSTASLDGRAQIVVDEQESICTPAPHLVFFLDGAHTPESLDVCVKWYSSAIRNEFQHTMDLRINHFHENGDSTKNTKKILLFNCMEKRDPKLLLPQILATCSSTGVRFSKTIFVPSLSSYHRVDSPTLEFSSDVSPDLTWQISLQKLWEKLTCGEDMITDTDTKQHENDGLLSDILPSSIVLPSLPLAIHWLRECARENPYVRHQVLVTGSLHLVGDVLKLLGRTSRSTTGLT